MPRASLKKPLKKTAKEAPKAKAETSALEETRYFEAVGRRKTAIARVRIRESKTPGFTINEKPIGSYLQETEYQKIAAESLEKGSPGKTFAVSAKVGGGGIHAQAEALRQGIARALVKFDNELRPSLKTLGFLTRDPRMRERKKFGLKRARRARQWRKR